MSKQTKANFKPVELTLSELDSVAGGLTSKSSSIQDRLRKVTADNVKSLI